MYIPFDELPDHSRVWVYQSNRPFTSYEKVELENGLRSLCDQWAAHGTPLHTSYILALNQFVILAVDERQLGASGCSIDSSVRYLKKIQSTTGLDFFDRTGVAFLENDKVILYPMTELKSLFTNGTLSGTSVALNNLVNTKAEWRALWKEPVKNSWMARYLPKSTVLG